MLGESIIYELIGENSLAGRYIDNAIYAEQPITEIVWHVVEGCLEISGVIEAAVAANLTIASPCLKLVGVQFINIWMIGIVEYATVEGAVISYGEASNANITINGIGTREEPVYNLNVQGNVDLQGENWVIDLSIRGERFEQSGSAVIPGVLDIDSSVISFSNTSLLEVGEYYLRGTEISYNGMLDARSGNLVIRYLGGGFVNICENLRAAGMVVLYSRTIINNYNQIVANGLEIICISFNNYGIANINEQSVFDLTDSFYNAGLGYIKTAEFYIGSKQAANGKTKLVKNEGRIEIGYGEIHAVELQNKALGFVKTDFIVVSNPYGACNKGKSFHSCVFYQENISSYPVTAVLDVARDLHLDVDVFKTVSSKISVEGKIFFYDASIIHEDLKLYQWGKCRYGGATTGHFNGEKSTSIRELSGYGQISYIGQSSVCCDKHGRWLGVQMATTKSAPAIKQSYNSRIYAKQGIEGTVRDILNLEMSWVDETQDVIGSGKDLVLYDSGSSAALSEIVKTQRALYLNLCSLWLK